MGQGTERESRQCEVEKIDYLNALPMSAFMWPLVFFLLWMVLTLCYLAAAVMYKFVIGEVLPLAIDVQGVRFLLIIGLLTSVMIGMAWERQARGKAEERRRSVYRLYLDSHEWRNLRGMALERADGRCQVCNSPRNLHAHHRTYSRLGIERVEDITVLCRRCHQVFHAGGRMPDQLAPRD